MGENENTPAMTQDDLRAQLEAAFADAPEDTGAADAAPEAPAETAPAEQPEAIVPDAPTQETPPPAPEAPAQSAPTEAAPAGQMDTVMQMVSRTADMLREVQAENQRLRELVGQQSEAAEAAAMNVATNPAPPAEMPILDLSHMAYMDADAQKTAATEYAQKLAAYLKTQMEGDIAPIREEYERQREDAARQSAIGALSNDAEFAGFADALPQIETILKNSPALSGEGDMQKRYALGYLISRGMDAMRAPKEVQRAPADIAREAMENPEVMRLIESERARQAEEKNANVPRHMASAGAAQAPATPEVRPKTMEEAREYMRRSFGL